MTQELADGRYTLPVRLFHWIVVVLVVAQFAVAWTMPEIGRGTLPVGLVAWHLAIGAAILAVALLRLGWRVSHKPAPPPSTLSPTLQRLSRGVHVLLYALLILLPLMGWINASARGWSVTLFGVIPLPALVAKGSSLGHEMGDIHATTAIIFLVVIGLHVAGALYHALVLRDRTLQRMF